MAKAKPRKEELIDELLNKHGLDPQAILGKDGLLEQLTKSIVERGLEAERTHHLGYESRRSSVNIRRAGKGWMTASSRCMRAG